MNKKVHLLTPKVISIPANLIPRYKAAYIGMTRSIWFGAITTITSWYRRPRFLKAVAHRVDRSSVDWNVSLSFVAPSIWYRKKN